VESALLNPFRRSVTLALTKREAALMTTTPQEPGDNPDVPNDPDVDPTAPLDPPQPPEPDELAEIGSLD
jgi:hypothetical protein